MLNHANAETMGRMDAGFQSDELKRQIRSFKKRKQEGKVESYYESTGEQINEGNIGHSKASKEAADYEKLREEAIYKEMDESVGSDNLASLDDLIKKKEKLAKL